ncbi:MAG: biopolymer transporter ExbD [Thiomicrorhabdus sp.]|nr:biopolymer transporter ExbD [Thiomicrorhabdus sp.]
MKRFDSINVIPLIDVILVLLAIVLMTASFIVKDSLNIELPETHSTHAYVPEQDSTPVYFHLDHNNQLYIDETPQTKIFALDFIKTLTTEQSIVIQVDKKAEFGHFVQLIDALKQQQLDKLTILTKASES